jgi:hypothetical protein
MSGTRSLLPWLPALLIVALGILALAAAAGRSPATKRLWLAAIAIAGMVALAATLWQGWAAGEQIARLKRNDRSAELAAQVKSLEDEIAKLKETTRARSLGAETAANLAGYLRSFGSRKVVVSCAPNNFEAYRYATQIANALKAANWDARGPERTTIFGDIRAMGINVYDNGERGSDTAQILLAGLAKFGIPYQSRVPPSEAVASGTVELFIGAKPGQPAVAAVEAAH